MIERWWSFILTRPSEVVTQITSTQVIISLSRCITELLPTVFRISFDQALFLSIFPEPLSIHPLQKIAFINEPGPKLWLFQLSHIHVIHLIGFALLKYSLLEFSPRQAPNFCYGNKEQITDRKISHLANFYETQFI